MSRTSEYCRAYPAAELRRYTAWSEKTEPLVVAGQGGEPDAAYFFLHDDFVVTAGAQRDEGVVFDAVDDAWKAYCRETLGFSPD